MRVTMERLRRAGLSTDDLEIVSGLFRTEKRGDRGSCACCGGRALPLDNDCGTCSILKTRQPRRYWHKVLVREGKLAF